MKKKSFIKLFATALIVCVFLASLSIVSVKAAEITDTANQLQGGIQKIEQAGEIITHPETQAEIVKAQWAKFLSGTAVGKFFVAATPYIKKFDPLFKLVLGTGFEWSWVFILSFVLASSLILFFKRFVSVFTVSFQIKSKLLDYGIPLLITILLSLTNITITITKLLVKLINIWFTTLLMQIIAGVGVAILIFWFFALSNIVKKLADNIRDALEKRKLKQTVKKLEEKVEKSEKRERGEKVPTEKEVEEELEEEEPTAEEKQTAEEKKRKEELRKKGERFVENIGRGIEESEKDETAY